MAKNVRRIKKRDESTLGVSVQDAVNDYLQSTHVKKLSPRTQEEYQQELKTFASWCVSHTILQNKKTKVWVAVVIDADSDQSPTLLHQVNDQAVHCFVEHLKSTHKPTKKIAEEISSYTLAGYVRVIKSFLNWCLLDEQYNKHVQSVVVQRIEKPQIIETILDTFSPEQISALIVACDKEESEHLQVRDRAIIAVLFDTGIRATELVTLKINHVSLDTKDPYIRILGKGNKWGEVGLGEQTRRYLQKYIRTFREPTVESEVEEQHSNFSAKQLKQMTHQVLQQSIVFMNRYGKPLTVSGLDQIVDRLGKWAHIEGVRCSPHTCRHTFSVMFIRNGGGIYQLSKLLRHSSVSTTENYLKSLKQSEARKGAKSLLDNL